MKEKFIDRSYALGASQECFTLEYYLMEDEWYTGEGFGICVYGIKIVKKNGKNIETEKLSSLCTDRNDCIEFIHSLAKGAVSPMSLRDVAYDWLCSADVEEKNSINFRAAI